MKINFLVHDGILEVGHTRAMIEVLRILGAKEEVSKIRIICLHSDPVEKLFPENHDKVEIITVPGKGIKPFLLKSVFFQIYTYLNRKKLISESDQTITMGICSFIGNIVNIQFYHRDWEKLYFKYNQGPFYKNLYKFILLKYFNLCEDYYYQKKNLRFGFLSKFIEKLMIDRYRIEEKNFITAYSSVNFSEFLPPEDFNLEKQKDLLTELSNQYPGLKNLDPNRPTLLFVGAFERKGLPRLLRNLPKDVNLIVIGKGEAHGKFKLPQREGIFPISYTTEISKFYLIADAFVFPTVYEPFGLVVTEAVASGTQVLVTKEKVGASEIVGSMEGVSFIAQDDENFSMQLKALKKLTLDKRMEWSHLRKKELVSLTWFNCAESWWRLLNQSK